MSRTDAYAAMEHARMALGFLKHGPYSRPTPEALAKAEADYKAAKAAYDAIMDKEDADWYAKRGLTPPAR
jgi:hypothetical protein